MSYQQSDSTTDLSDSKIDTLAKYIASGFSWSISDILQSYAPIFGFLVIYAVSTIGGFYSACLACNINQVVIMTAYAFVVSLFLLQTSLERRKCSPRVKMNFLALYSVLPTLIFVITYTIPLWSGLNTLWVKTQFGPILPVSVLAGLVSVFVGMVIYRTTTFVSEYYLYRRLCEGDKTKSLWTFYI